MKGEYSEKFKGINKFKNKNGIWYKVCTKCLKYYPLNGDYFIKQSKTNCGFYARCRGCMNGTFEKGVKEGPRSNNWKGKLLICKRCNVPKKEKEFGPDKREKYRNFKSCYCRNCCRKFGKATLLKVKNDLNHYITRLVYGIKGRVRSSNRDKIRNLEFDITANDVLNLWKKQKGLCAISGLKMLHISLEGRQHRNCSVDRIDTNKGYVKDNIQLVCTIINSMKSDLSMKQLMHFCKRIINNYGK